MLKYNLRSFDLLGINIVSTQQPCFHLFHLANTKSPLLFSTVQLRFDWCLKFYFSYVQKSEALTIYLFTRACLPVFFCIPSLKSISPQSDGLLPRLIVSVSLSCDGKLHARNTGSQTVQLGKTTGIDSNRGGVRTWYDWYFKKMLA